MKVWMIRETEYPQYACRPGSTEPDFGDICACRFRTPTPSNWRDYDWYIFNSKEQAEWYKEGIEAKERALMDERSSKNWKLQLVEVDISFNGFADIEQTSANAPTKEEEAVPPPVQPPRLTDREEHDIKCHLDKSIKILLDMMSIAENNDSPTIAVLAYRIHDYLSATKRILFREDEEDED